MTLLFKEAGVLTLVNCDFIAADGLQNIPFCKKATSNRTFSSYDVCTHRLWNALPLSVRNCISKPGDDAVSPSSFKSMLKTYLFSAAFGDGIM